MAGRPDDTILKRGATAFAELDKITRKVTGADVEAAGLQLGEFLAVIGEPAAVLVGDVLVELRGGHGADGQPVEFAPLEHDHVVEVDEVLDPMDSSFRLLGEEEVVVARIAPQRVLALAAIDEIVVIPAVELVVALFTAQDIVAGAAGSLVIAFPEQDDGLS